MLRTRNRKTEEKTVSRPKSVEEYSPPKAIRFSKELLNRMNALFVADNPYSSFNLSKFVIEAVEEKITKMEKKKTR